MSEKVENQPKTITPGVIVVMLIFVVVVPFLPLLISRQWDWWEAWVYAIISILGFAISRVLAARRHPDIIAERARFLQHEDAKSWDKFLAPLVGLGGVLILLVVGLDALFGWSSPFSLPVKILALLIILTGYALGILCLDRKPFLLWHGSHPDRTRPSSCIKWPLSLDAPSRVCRGAADLPGHAYLSRFTMGIPARIVSHACLGHSHQFGR